MFSNIAIYKSIILLLNRTILFILLRFCLRNKLYITVFKSCIYHLQKRHAGNEASV